MTGAGDMYDYKSLEKKLKSVVSRFDRQLKENKLWKEYTQVHVDASNRRYRALFCKRPHLICSHSWY